MLQYIVLIGVLGTLQTHAFWWPTTTTEAPSTVLQQIPLTYFRTYTYQPLTGNPFSFPLFGFGAAQTPLLSSPRYNPYAVTSYAAARRHDTGSKTGVTPPAPSSSPISSSSTTTTPAPTTTTTPSTTTTTTTTTTPTPTTTTSTESQVPPRYSYQSEYPTYNRRVNNLYNARPQYPYPDYFNYQPQATLTDKSGARIQFVPCMCPVSVSGMTQGSGIGSRPAVSISSSGSTVDTVPSENRLVNLQARNMDDDEEDEEDSSDDEHDDEEQQAAAELGYSTPPAALSSSTTRVKLFIEAHPETTPIVEANSLL